MSDWQPIETAPLDGTDILICGGTRFYDEETYPSDYPFEGVVIARWHRQNLRWEGPWGREFDGRWWHRPTHWMSLPPLPGE